MLKEKEELRGLSFVFPSVWNFPLSEIFGP